MFTHKTYAVNPHQNCLKESALIMRVYSICFLLGIKTIISALSLLPFLSGALISRMLCLDSLHTSFHINRVK